jgi:uncharacterized protein
MLRVVLDTVIFVRALINPTGRWGTILFDYADCYSLVVSPPLLAELLEVLARPRVRRKFTQLGGRWEERILELLAEQELVELASIPSVARDPNDDKFLATAVAGRATYVVSEDEDLLVLGEYQNVKIIDGLAFIHILEHERL